jgi:hypothetical protein
VERYQYTPYSYQTPKGSPPVVFEARSPTEARSLVYDRLRAMATGIRWQAQRIRGESRSETKRRRKMCLGQIAWLHANVERLT